MISIIVVSKDEPDLDQTLSSIAAQAAAVSDATETIVIDASCGRLTAIARRHPEVHWIDYTAPLGVHISIPHQRNCGLRMAQGEIIVFIDAGCLPRDRWLELLIAPLRDHQESVVAGLAVAPARSHSHYGLEVERVRRSPYLDEAPTLNLAITTEVVAAVGPFDERFEYGSDLDFSWRLRKHGFRIRSEPEAVVEHDWGSARRQLRRAYQYGRGKARLYRKHSSHRRAAWRRDPVTVIYPLFLLGLPLTMVLPAYPFLLFIPAWRNRHYGPLSTVIDHLAYGVGVLSIACQR